MKTKLNVNIGCVISLKWSLVIQNVAELAFHYRIPTIKVSQHLVAICDLLISPPRSQESSVS